MTDMGTPPSAGQGQAALGDASHLSDLPGGLKELAPQLRGQVVPILDFGSQYAQLIARRVREAGVLSVLTRPNISIEQLKSIKPKGLILSGGPSSVYEHEAPRCDPRLFELDIPYWASATECR